MLLKSANPADLKIHKIKTKMETIQLLLSAKNDILVWKIMKENTNFAC